MYVSLLTICLCNRRKGHTRNPGEHMKNVGRLDQQVRYGVGALLLAYAGISFFVELPLVTTAAILGASLLVTARLRLCGLYRLIGINTCPIDERK